MDKENQSLFTIDKNFGWHPLASVVTFMLTSSEQSAGVQFSLYARNGSSIP